MFVEESDGSVDGVHDCEDPVDERDGPQYAESERDDVPAFDAEAASHNKRKVKDEGRYHAQVYYKHNKCNIDPKQFGSYLADKDRPFVLRKKGLGIAGITSYGGRRAFHHLCTTLEPEATKNMG